MKKRYQIFISSTYSDLKLERQAAVEAILKAGHIPAGMELFSAGEETQLDIVKRWIDESDIYLLILGGRYGSIEEKTQHSYTEIEYDYAVGLRKPYFAVVMSDAAVEEKVKKEGLGIVERENTRKYEDFKKKVLSKISTIVEDKKDVQLAILQSIMTIEDRFNLDGWIRASRIPAQIQDPNAQVQFFNESGPDHPEFTLVDSFPKNGESIKVEEIRNVFLKFSNPVDRRTVMFIQSSFFKMNMNFQWNVNGYIQYAENDTKLIWRAHESIIKQQPPFSNDDLEYHRFEIFVGHGAPEASLRDVYGNTLPQVIIPVHIKA